MQQLNNSKQCQDIVELIPNIRDKIEKTINEYNNYLEHLKNGKYEEIPNEQEEDAIKRAESIYDRLDEIVRRRKLVVNNGKETIESIDKIRIKMESVVKRCKNDEIYLGKSKDGLIEKIIELEERKMNKEIEPLQKQIDLIKQRFNNKKKEWDTQRIGFEDIKNAKEEINRKNIGKKGNVIHEFEEIKQIEEWTNMKIGNIIFDSDVDNWNVSSSVFHQKILNKCNLIFIIEGEDDNIFGSYINAKIDRSYPKHGRWPWITDPKSFLFSLKSNKRLNGMLKFDIQDPSYTFWLGDNLYEGLFGLGRGNDIRICKENNKTLSYCKQTTTFDYNGIQTALCGKENFTPTRIIVIQLI